MAIPGIPTTFSLSKGIRSKVRLADGNQMPVLGLGVWKAPPGHSTRAAVGHALSVGYRLIDTAAMYGNEADVGEAVRRSGIPRDEIFVTTKVWNDDQGFEETLRAFDRSQRLLGIGVIDLYLIHWPVPAKRLETWRALRHLQGEGRCRSIGVSNFTVAHLEEFRTQSNSVPVIDQVEFNPYLFQRDLLEHCRSVGIQMEAWAPLVRGLKMEDPVLHRLAEVHGVSTAQVLIRWGLQHDVVQIPKSVQPHRIEENARVFEFQLDAEEMSAVDSLDAQFRTAWDPSTMA
jgi:diketogulonate reductase-like aldo/keto reductase